MIAQNDIRKAAKLAKLKFSDAEIENYTTQLGSIMDMIVELQKVDTSNVKPLASVHDFTLRLREDAVTERDLGNDLFVSSPGKNSDLSKEIKCFIVPKVVE